MSLRYEVALNALNFMKGGRGKGEPIRLAKTEHWQGIFHDTSRNRKWPMTVELRYAAVHLNNDSVHGQFIP